uniref:F-box domain-containing protein n=1 Tax=Steinernema glaseri TaxID=37863 RepID=A0A1I7Y222_9BILA
MKSRNDWSSFSFGDTKLSFWPDEINSHVLPLCFGKVHIVGGSFINTALETLLERPITHITISEAQLREKNRDLFKKFIMKPSVRSVRLLSQKTLPESIENDLYEFVKKPNFLALEAPLSSIPKLVDYWNSLTTFPNHMQRVRFSQPLTTKMCKDLGPRRLANEILLECDCKDTNMRPLRHVCYYHSLPNNRSKYIELFSERPLKGATFTEICLTSGNASSITEFTDYANFAFRSSQEAFKQGDCENLKIKCIKEDYVCDWDAEKESRIREYGLMLARRYPDQIEFDLDDFDFEGDEYGDEFEDDYYYWITFAQLYRINFSPFESFEIL